MRGGSEPYFGADEDARGANRLLTVRAPLTGSVTALAIAPGALINDDTQPIMSVADLSIVWTEILAMAAIGAVYFAFALRRFRHVIFGT